MRNCADLATQKHYLLNKQKNYSSAQSNLYFIALLKAADQVSYIVSNLNCFSYYLHGNKIKTKVCSNKQHKNKCITCLKDLFLEDLILLKFEEIRVTHLQRVYKIFG